MGFARDELCGEYASRRPRSQTAGLLSWLDGATRPHGEGRPSQVAQGRDFEDHRLYPMRKRAPRACPIGRLTAWSALSAMQCHGVLASTSSAIATTLSSPASPSAYSKGRSSPRSKRSLPKRSNPFGGENLELARIWSTSPNVGATRRSACFPTSPLGSPGYKLVT